MVTSNHYRSNTLQPKKLENVGPKTGLINQSAINLYSNKFTGPYRCYLLIRVRVDGIGLLSVFVGSLSFKVVLSTRILSFNLGRKRAMLSSPSV